jgi:uncharacterized membrane protein YeaQ/YmgE (transglycosylase-associated protein family)
MRKGRAGLWPAAARSLGGLPQKYLAKEIMHIIGTFITGLIVGIVAKLLMPGRDPGGFIITGLLGIAGAFVAKYIGQQIGWYGPDDAVGFVASVIGAVILLAIYRVLFRRRTAP